MKKVLITTSSFGKAASQPLDICKEKCEVILNPYGRKLTIGEFLALSEEVDGVIAGVEQITRDTLKQRPNLKVISRCGVGMDNVDLDACREMGIQVFNTPNAPVDSVAELVVTVILDLLKNVSDMSRDLKSGKWNKMSGSMLKDKRIGIIGMGRIGQRVACLLSAFQVEIAYADIEKKDNEYKYMEKTELLEWADIISLHTSNCAEGEYIIGADDIGHMKKSAYLINTSRGKFVDERALYTALKEQRLQGAALDVFTKEPYDGELCTLDNIILTPHISSSAKESRAIMELEAVCNLFEGLGITYDKSNYF